ncbi:MAG: hypothetical protein ISS26_07375 [Candidatus Omnitrophica bacterium]|nr:hypothetical protein [Candidatus Omnitrophota bacterium]
MKRIPWLLVVICMIVVTSGVAAADDEVMSISDAEQKASETHKLASKDVIFIDEELKALYYQNIQIIGLLKEIKQLLGKTLSDIAASIEKLEEKEQ